MKATNVASIVRLASLAAVAVLAGACARVDDEARRAALRAADIADINNLMSLHSWYHAAMQNDVELEKIWSKRPDVIWAQQSGYFKGMDSIRKYYGQKATPETTEGGFVWHTITSPVVVVAGDRQTAKGVWYTPGVGGKLNRDGSGNAGWMWEKYGVDFVREDGEWKIWHMKVYTDFSVPVGGRMGEGGGMGPPPVAAKPGKAAGAEKIGATETQGGGAPPAGAPPPQAQWDYTYQHPYEGWAAGVSPRLVPQPPVPYQTFSETWSYADEGE